MINYLKENKFSILLTIGYLTYMSPLFGLSTTRYYCLLGMFIFMEIMNRVNDYYANRSIKALKDTIKTQEDSVYYLATKMLEISEQLNVKTLTDEECIDLEKDCAEILKSIKGIQDCENANDIDIV